MINSDQWFVPLFNGEFHDKPGMQYFFMQVAYFFFGVNPFSARLFSVLFGVATVLVIYRFTRKHANENIAILTSLVLITSLQLGFQFKMSVPDPYLIFFLTCAFASFFQAYNQNKRTLYLFYLFAGLGFVTKGPIAIALPALVVFIFLLLIRDFKISTILWCLNWKGIVIFLLMAAPWYVVNGLSTQWEWTEYFFITHNVDRYLNTFEGHGGFPMDTFVLFFAALLPFSIFLPQAIAMTWRARKTNPLLVFSSAVCLSFCGFFLFSRTVLPGYVSPALPFGAIILAYYLNHLLESEQKNNRARINIIVLAILTIVLVVVGYFALQHEATLVHLSTPVVLALMLLPAGAVLGYILLSRKVSYALLVIGSSFLLFQIVLYSFLMPQADQTNPVLMSKKLIEESGRPMAYYRRMNPAFVIQHHQNIKKLSTAEDVHAFVKEHGEVLIISTLRDWQHEEN